MTLQVTTQSVATEDFLFEFHLQGTRREKLLGVIHQIPWLELCASSDTSKSNHLNNIVL